MKINISINEVLRDFVGQLVYTYNKYYSENEDTQIKETDITDYNLSEFLKFDSFKTLEDLNRFIYLEEPLVIFGHADQTSENLITRFNQFLLDIKDEEEHQIKLVSKEVDKSITSTFFFLSKTGCRINDLKFVQDSADEWDDADILITANPDALAKKPNGKISVKINAVYNANATADFTLDSILEFIKDENVRSKILNTKIITYEEI